MWIEVQETDGPDAAELVGTIHALQTDLINVQRALAINPTVAALYGEQTRLVNEIKDAQSDLADVRAADRGVPV